MIELAQLDPGYAVCNFPSDKLEATERRLVVKKNAASGEQIVRLAIVNRAPVRK